MYLALLIIDLYFISMFVRSTWNNGWETINILGIVGFPALAVVIICFWLGSIHEKKHKGSTTIRKVVDSLQRSQKRLENIQRETRES